MEDNTKTIARGISGTLSSMHAAIGLDAGRAGTARDMRVLVVEDEAIQAAHIASMLRTLGYAHVECVYNAQAAVDTASGGEIDLILMDVQMPGKDGLQAAREIMATHGPRIGIVLLTAYSDVATVQRARDAGVVGYLVKPVTSQQLAPALEVAAARCLDLRRARGRADELERRLEERKVTERAKWVLVQRHGVGEQEAWTLLQKASRATRCKLADMAKRVVDGQPLPGAPSIVRRLERAGTGTGSTALSDEALPRRPGRFYSARDEAKG